MSFLRAMDKVLPAAWARAGREAVARARLRPLVRRFEDLAPGATPSPELVEALKRAWGNPGWSADTPFLCAVAEHAARADGPILECGSGLSTLVLALVAGRRGVPVVALEHDAAWHARVSRRLRALGVSGATIVLAPLRTYGDYSWYDAPASALPPRVRLVVCDGPPQDTPGGRYGAVPSLRAYLAHDLTILLDDATRPGELDALARWRREDGLTPRTCGLEPAGFAVVQRGAGA